MSALEQAEFSHGESRVSLHGEENVILQLREAGAETWRDATTWGFVSIADWRAFLKSCLRFDDALGLRP